MGLFRILVALVRAIYLSGIAAELKFGTRTICAELKFGRRAIYTELKFGVRESRLKAALQDALQDASLLIAIFFPVFLSAQIPAASNLREKTFPVKDTIGVDSLSLVPETVQVFDKNGAMLVPKNTYRIADNKLVFLQKPAFDSVKMVYRVFPYAFSNTFKNKGIQADTVKKRNGIIDTVFYYRPEPTATAGSFEFSGLDYSGSFSRGLSFGNSQSLVLNSGFNLQLSGKLGDDIEIAAALTDNNVPLQPDGNTQQLQEFDKLFVRIKRRNTSITAGDYELRRPEGAYFVNYLKKSQGGTLASSIETPGNGVLRFDLSGAISRGKFGRNIFQGQEGNQGPYRLTGNDGERFIIVLAGTERVYIDGQPMHRGLDKDYIIDYNQGELTFTSNRLITKDIRIQVEFGYSDQNYVRSLYALNAHWEAPGARLHFNLFSEQDGKNQPSQFELTEEDKRTLRDAGDNPLNAVRSSIDSLETGFDANRVLYELVDTVVNGVLYDSVLVYSPNPERAHYTATFAIVGEKNGNYVLAPSAVNGRVYRWVAPNPLTGERSGNFEPVSRLVSPKRLQMYALGGEFDLKKAGTLMVEGALSRNDLNTFSSLDAADDLGFAGRVGYKGEFYFGDTVRMKNDTVKPVRKSLVVSAQYEGLQRNFQFIEPYRVREFQRDWNLEQNFAKTQEHWLTAGVALQGTKWGFVKYEGSVLSKDSVYLGAQNRLSGELRHGGFLLKTNNGLLFNRSSFENGLFLRPKVDISQTFKKINNFTTGVYWEREQNRRLDPSSDTLLRTAFWYDLLKAYAEIPATDSSLYARLSFSRRYDFAPDSNRFVNATTADEWAFNGAWNVRKDARLSANFVYRNLVINDTLLSALDPLKTYLGRLEYQHSFFKGAIKSATIYEIGGGQQRRLDFVYLKVNPGEGVYTWIDRNNDSIPQLNEFEISVFQDQASYLRITQFTDEFIRTNNVLFSQSLTLSPKSFWSKPSPKSFKAFLNRFSLNALVRVDRRTLSSAQIQTFNPFQLNVPDTLLVSLQTDVRNTLFFNRSNQKYSAELAQSSTRQRTSPATGYEERSKAEQYVRFRWNPSTSIGIQALAGMGTQGNDSEIFNDRDYQLSFYRLEPQFTWLYDKKLRLTLNYRFKHSQNKIGLAERSTVHDITAEGAWNKPGVVDIRLKATFAGVDFSGNPASPVGYAMLDALQKGKNFLWSLTLRRNLNKFIELSVGYEGRKTGEAKVIHIGRAQVRASF